MVAIVADDVVRLYNYIWQWPRQTGVAADLILVASRTNDFTLYRVDNEVDQNVIWKVYFTLLKEHWVGPTFAQQAGEVWVCDHHPKTHQGGWGGVEYEKWKAAGKFKISKITGDLTRFQKDWTMLLMFGHEWKHDYA